MNGKVIMELNDYNQTLVLIRDLQNELNETKKSRQEIDVKYYKLRDTYIKQVLTCTVNSYYVKDYGLDDFLNEKNYILRDEYKLCTEAEIDIDYCKQKVTEKYNEVKKELEEEKAKENKENDK